MLMSRRSQHKGLRAHQTCISRMKDLSHLLGVMVEHDGLVPACVFITSEGLCLSGSWTLSSGGNGPPFLTTRCSAGQHHCKVTNKTRQHQSFRAAYTYVKTCCVAAPER